RDECPHRLQDATSHKPVILHSSAVHWNDFRKKWVMIAQELNGTSKLGEIWFAEAGEAQGPWSAARKIVTHEKYGLDNPDYHDFFDGGDGRFIYFEATYSNALSETDRPTPRYDYNQIMYRL